MEAYPDPDGMCASRGSCYRSRFPMLFVNIICSICLYGRPEMYIFQHGIVIRARDHRQMDAVAPIEDEGVEGADPVRRN